MADLGASPALAPQDASRLSEILELDREAERALRDRQSEIRSELMALENGRKGLRGYRAGAGAPKVIDERG
jgi:hypothetical protein